jgi:hypothetical protein
MHVADVRLAVGINGVHADQPRGVGKESRAMEGSGLRAKKFARELGNPKFVRKDRVRNEATEVFVARAVELPIERCSFYQWAG